MLRPALKGHDCANILYQFLNLPPAAIALRQRLVNNWDSTHTVNGRSLTGRVVKPSRLQYLLFTHVHFWQSVLTVYAWNPNFCFAAMAGSCSCVVLLGPKLLQTVPTFVQALSPPGCPLSFTSTPFNNWDSSFIQVNVSCNNLVPNKTTQGQLNNPSYNCFKLEQEYVQVRWTSIFLVSNIVTTSFRNLFFLYVGCKFFRYILSQSVCCQTELLFFIFNPSFQW